MRKILYVIDWDTTDWGNVTADNADDVDDNNVVFSCDDWKNLSAEQRQQKVKSFLRKIAHVGNDAKNLKPFIKDLNVGKDPYGIDSGRKYKTFDRATHRFGHPPAPTTYKESISFPNSSGQGHDPLHKGHELHKTLQKFGYAYSHTTPIHSANGEVIHHHTWSHLTGHKVGSYEGSTEWSSKVSSASGHVHTGCGKASLEKHLQNKMKRYKLQNNNNPYWGSVRHNQENEETLPATKLQESLIDPAGYKRVARYAEWMKKNRASAFGVVGGSYEVDNPAKALVEAEKLKAKVAKRFGQGKDQSEWGLFDARSGKPK